jgi:hypothetical protein
MDWLDIATAALATVAVIASLLYPIDKRDD